MPALEALFLREALLPVFPAQPPFLILPAQPLGNGLPLLPALPRPLKARLPLPAQAGI